MIAIVVVLFFGSFGLMPIIGTSYFASMGSNMLIANIEMPRGTDIITTYDIVLEAEEILTTQPEVIDYSSKIGVGGNSMEVYFTLSGSSNLAQISFTVWVGQPAHMRVVGKMPGVNKYSLVGRGSSEDLNGAPDSVAAQHS